MSTLYFEDFAPGRVFELGSRVLSEREIVAFAADWDPQAMHVQPGDGLIASGWQTACVWMRLYVDEVLSRAAIFEEVWGYDMDLASNSLEVYIGYIRRKLEAGGEVRLVHTVRGVGYVLRVPEAA